MNYQNFEDYLIEMHAQQYRGFDDEMSDDYQMWISNLSVDEWISLGNFYGSIKKMSKKKDNV